MRPQRTHSIGAGLSPMGAAKESDEAAVWEGAALLAKR